jgi:hypothetical protein
MTNCLIHPAADQGGVGEGRIYELRITGTASGLAGCAIAATTCPDI